MAHLALLGHTPQVSKMDRDGIDNPRWAVRCTACHISSHVTPRGVPMCGTDLLEGASAMLTENTCEESKRLPPVFFDPSRRGATP